MQIYNAMLAGASWHKAIPYLRQTPLWSGFICIQPLWFLSNSGSHHFRSVMHATGFHGFLGILRKSQPRVTSSGNLQPKQRLSARVRVKLWIKWLFQDKETASILTPRPSAPRQESTFPHTKSVSQSKPIMTSFKDEFNPRWPPVTSWFEGERLGKPWN